MKSLDSLDVLETLDAEGGSYRYFSLAAAERAGLKGISRLPMSLKIVLENLLRNEDGRIVGRDDLYAMVAWLEGRCGEREIAYYPTRIVMPDSSGIPLLADLAAMRDAMVRLGGDPDRINPMTGVDLVVDHSVIVDVHGRPDALQRNMAIEYQRNTERYAFLRWAQQAFRNLRIIPPGNGIIHQVNIEFLSRVVWSADVDGETLAYPDCVLGMDSHTPMVNGLGVLGWGCGGIEAGAAMLGQPVSMRLPEVVGVRLVGKLPEGTTATDLVLTITQRLRAHGVVQKFVEYWGPGVDELALPDRSTLANMAPEYGATVGYFPIDREALDYLHLSGRDPEHIALVEAYAKAQGLWRDADTPEPLYTEVIEIDLGGIEPSLAGPRRPQDRVPLSGVPESLQTALTELLGPDPRAVAVPLDEPDAELRHGDLALAAITSCTNTSNPSVMFGAGLLARNAVARGLGVKPWVKTSLAPGSRVVADYLQRSGLQDDLDALGFHLVGFGCTTCMGNSGPLNPAVEQVIDQYNLVLGAVLSGNRNFEGRVHPQCRVNYLASPPLVVAYAIAGTLAIDLSRDPLGEDAEGKPIFLADIWPSAADIRDRVREIITPDLYRMRYRNVFAGDERWQALPVRGGDTFDWSKESWYIRRPPFFADTGPDPEPLTDIVAARALVMLGDSITTDHISPVGAIPRSSAAGRFLIDNGIEEANFNSYAARRVNHEVMIRGTFANVRLRNELVAGREGGYTRHLPDGEEMTIHEAAVRYAREGVPLVVVAGRDYGAGSSRDWAAKGTRLLGVRAVIAESLERIHRSNLIGMGVLPLQFRPGENRRSLGLDGTETYHIEQLDRRIAPGAMMPCRIQRADGSATVIELLCRLDTAYEVDYFRNGGILHYMLRQLLTAA